MPTPQETLRPQEMPPFPTSENPQSGPSTLGGGVAGSSLGATGTAPGSPGMGMGGSSAAPTSDVLNRVVQGAHQTIDRLAERAAPAVQRLTDGVHTANDSLHHRADELRDLGSEWTESLRTTVRENPLAAVATALAIGVLIARLTR